MIVVGLTGGIASGKSTVSGMLRMAGAIVIDADVLARQVVQPGMPAWLELRSLFGMQILKPDNTIDRAALGGLVFADEPLRKQLESIIHPRVRQRLSDETSRIIRQFPKAVVIQDVPLLLEAGMIASVEEIIVVYIPEALQLQRLMTRDKLTADQAWARIRAQMPIDDKRKMATILIDNRYSIEQTRQKALAVYAQLASRAVDMDKNI